MKSKKTNLKWQKIGETDRFKYWKEKCQKELSKRKVEEKK